MVEYIQKCSVAACTECVDWVHIYKSVDWLNVLVNCASVGWQLLLTVINQSSYFLATISPFIAQHTCLVSCIDPLSGV